MRNSFLGSAWVFALLLLIPDQNRVAQATPSNVIAAGGPATVGAEVTQLRVDRFEDDREPGSLRWAIEISNADPGPNRIEISAPEVGQPLIRLNSPLPPIKGPLAIIGTAWQQDGRYTVIDGSGYLNRDLQSCPGATDGQFGTNIRATSFPGLALLDTREVTLQGLEIRNFCIGVLVLRTSYSEFIDNRFVRNIGGAGLMFSGDDGSGGSTATTTNNNKVLRNLFYENGDGLELTRGAAFNLVADNIFDAGEDNLEPSQGIEILWGNDNTVVRNEFRNYTDGLQINWGARNYIGANSFIGNAFGISVTGNANVIDGNEIRENGVGIAVRPEAAQTLNRLRRNLLADNGQLILRCWAGGSCDENLPRAGIVFGVPGLEHVEYVGSRGRGVIQNPETSPHICSSTNHLDGCQLPPQMGLQAPDLTSVQLVENALQVSGRVIGPPAMRMEVEVFSGAPGTNEGARYLGSLVISTDAQGAVEFIGRVAVADPGAAITATVTTAMGASSVFSAPIRLE